MNQANIPIDAIVEWSGKNESLFTDVKKMCETAMSRERSAKFGDVASMAYVSCHALSSVKSKALKGIYL